MVSNLRGTAFVSENAGTVVMRHQGKYFIRLNGSNEWSEYPTEASK